MKTIPLFVLALAVPAFAGTSAKETVAPAAAPEPCVFTWFTGASIGYLTELEEPMYNLHLGTDTCWNLGGWNVSLFAEIGYAQKDDDWSGSPVVPVQQQVTPVPQEVPGTNLQVLDPVSASPSDSIGGDFGRGLGGNLDDLESLLSGLASSQGVNTGYDFDVMPITLNAKLERPLANNFNMYFGGGIGMALVDLSIDAGPIDFSDDDWVFTGQIFAGVNYNFNQDFEVYGGARWIYYDDAGLSDNGISGDLEMDDDFLFELGARFNF